MKELRWLLALEALMAISLFLLFAKDPIFPATRSTDFFSHLQIASSIAHGVIPPFSSLLLYAGIEFYLALAVKLFPAVPVETIRLAMGLLVLISPFVVYATVKEILDAKAGLWSAALYTLSGFVWFEFTQNAGLYPNFWGLLSSLMLIATVVWYAKD